MSARMEPRKRSRKIPKKRAGKAPYRFLPLALTGAVGAILVVALVLGITSLTGGGSEEPSGVTSSPSPTDLQREGLLEVSDTDVDLGQVALDQWVDHTFVLRNTSAGTLTVTVSKESIETLDGC